MIHIRPVIFAFVCAVSSALAQVPTHPEAQSPLDPNPYLRHTNAWRWDIRAQVFIRGGVLVRLYDDGQRDEVTGRFDTDKFEYIFPIVREGGFYWSPNPETRTAFRINDTVFEPDEEILRTPDSNAQYLIVRSEDAVQRAQRFERDIRQLHFKHVSHIVSADTVVDAQRAKTIPWPDEWPDDAQRFLTPIIDRIDEDISIRGQDALCLYVLSWTEGHDPRSIDQYTLVKYLTGHAIQHVRFTTPKGANVPILSTGAFTSSVDLSFPSVPENVWSGLNVRSADRVALDPDGSEFDMSTFLVGVLRASGVPARLVIGFDQSANIDYSDRITALVEFAMIDPDTGQTLWIPIDPERLRDNGRRAHIYEQPWMYFGSHDRLHSIVPLAHYFHPPTNFDSYGWPALFGFRAAPRIDHALDQTLMIDIMNSPFRGLDEEPWVKKKPKNNP